MGIRKNSRTLCSLFEFAGGRRSLVLLEIEVQGLFFPGPCCSQADVPSYISQVRQSSPFEICLMKTRTSFSISLQQRWARVFWAALGSVPEKGRVRTPGAVVPVSFAWHVWLCFSMTVRFASFLLSGKIEEYVLKNGSRSRWAHFCDWEIGTVHCSDLEGITTQVISKIHFRVFFSWITGMDHTLPYAIFDL